MTDPAIPHRSVEDVPPDSDPRPSIAEMRLDGDQLGVGAPVLLEIAAAVLAHRAAGKIAVAARKARACAFFSDDDDEQTDAIEASSDADRVYVQRARDLHRALAKVRQ